MGALFGQDSKEQIDSYLHSPLYYMITGRKGAWLYKNTHSALVVCVHPHIEHRLVVFPEIGKADFELTVSVLSTLTPPKNGIQLARYTEEGIAKLKRQLTKLSYTPVIGISDTEETVLDWRYPLHILDTGQVSEMKGKPYQKIRNMFRNAAQHVTSAPLNEKNSLRFMKAALKFWEGNMIFNEKDTEDMSEFYHELFKIIERHPGALEGLLFLQGRKPVGFTAWDCSGRDTANMFVNLGDTSISGLSDYQMVTTCQTLHEKGINRLNLGGSELQSLDAFKTKFHPAESLKIHSADIIYRAPLIPHVEVHTIVDHMQHTLNTSNPS